MKQFPRWVEVHYTIFSPYGVECATGMVRIARMDIGRWLMEQMVDGHSVCVDKILAV